MKKNDEPLNELQKSRRELIRKILLWLIVFFIVIMMILVVIFNPKFYTFVDLIT